MKYKSKNCVLEFIISSNDPINTSFDVLGCARKPTSEKIDACEDG